MKLKRELIMMIIYSVMNHQKKSLIIRNHIPHKRKMIIFIVAHQKNVDDLKYKYLAMANDLERSSRKY